MITPILAHIDTMKGHIDRYFLAASLSPDGTFAELRMAHRKLCLFAEPSGFTWLASWGPSMTHEMAEGTLLTADDVLPLLDWLVTGENPPEDCT